MKSQSAKAIKNQNQQKGNPKIKIKIAKEVLQKGKKNPKIKAKIEKKRKESQIKMIN